jgi:chromate transporter
MSETDGKAAAIHREPVPLWAIAFTYLKIALESFGGGLSAWTRQAVVEERRWLTDEEFLSAMTLCRLLPGPNQINFAVYLGTRLRGWKGAAAALFGLVAVPLTLVLVAGRLYFRYHHLPAMDSALSGMAAVAIGLTLSMGFKLVGPFFKRPGALALVVAAFAGTIFFAWPLALVLGVFGSLGILLARFGIAERKNKAVEPLR